MNTTAHAGNSATRPAASASQAADAGPANRLGSSLRTVLKRVVAFVVPPDDKIAQTWRWLL